MADVQDRAEALAREGHFLGGPVDDFEQAGRMQLELLLREGLHPASRVLDVGCGCLRGGYWLIHFLDQGRYCGIEPNDAMLELGQREILEREVWAKWPRFAMNDDWDFSVFGQQFDFVLARSVWTHAAKSQIEAMLDSFRRVRAPGAKFLASYLPASWRRRDYKGAEWAGRDHHGGEPRLVAHSFKWIHDACAERGLWVEKVPGLVLNGQRWLRIE